jgi:uncharacterized heparinase superfamily protein
MTFTNGTVPHFNDTTEAIAYSPKWLLETGKSMGLNPRKVSVKESGYRILEVETLKLIADVEGIKPSYQPGHAHADTFSFVLHQGSSPIIVDPGISTYNISPRRDWERSTLAHNTVTIDRNNSSQVWSGFRIGKRATVTLLEDSSDVVTATHNGFGSQIHERSFEILENRIQIKDRINNLKSGAAVEARFYFHPDISPKFKPDNIIELGDELIMKIKSASKLEIHDYQYCLGYNCLKPAKYLIVTFENDSLTSSFYSI